MKVLIRSLMSGSEPFRAAAHEAVLQLEHEPVMTDGFGMQTDPSHMACVDVPSQSALVILLLGERYGPEHHSGVIATHREYREVMSSRLVIGSIQESIMPKPRRQPVGQEGRGWENGLFRGHFTTPDQLKNLITSAIQQWQVLQAAEPLNEGDLLQRPGTDQQ